MVEDVEITVDPVDVASEGSPLLAAGPSVRAETSMPSGVVGDELTATRGVIGEVLDMTSESSGVEPSCRSESAADERGAGREQRRSRGTRGTL